MTTVSVSGSDKEEFVEMKPDDMSQKEFFGELLAAKRRDEGEIVDIDELVEGIEHRIASEIELSAYRGTKEALENHERN